MAWNEITDDAEAKQFIKRMGGFHNWYVIDMHYDPLARADKVETALEGHYYTDTDEFSLKLRFGPQDKSGNWPEIELRFNEVATAGFSNFEEPDSLKKCSIEKTGCGWAFLSDYTLSAEERESPTGLKSNLFAIANHLYWRGENLEQFGQA